jgi:hypothetical protein
MLLGFVESTFQVMLLFAATIFTVHLISFVIITSIFYSFLSLLYERYKSYAFFPPAAATVAAASTVPVHCVTLNHTSWLSPFLSSTANVVTCVTVPFSSDIATSCDAGAGKAGSGLGAEVGIGGG